MKILVLADVPSKALWDYYDGKRLKGYDLVLSAGDLPAAYLSFIVTFCSCPVLYVHGNHDDRYRTAPPEGCECIEDQIYNFNGLRILGLGGSMQYKPSEAPYTQYTEKAMENRIRHLRWKIRRSNGFDILLTHAPARGIGDQEDLCHRGFEAFLPLIDEYSPSYMIHGHVHMNYSTKIRREEMHGSTTIINAYEKYELEIPDPPAKQEAEHSRRHILTTFSIPRSWRH